jgi:glycerol-3-phosphate dehydrogenase
MTERFRVLILGYGEMGHAMEYLLKERQQLDIWEKFPRDNVQSVILKNVYAMVFGMADELQLGDNMRGYLSVAALRELDQIVLKMGGQAGSPYHLAGLGT